MKNTSNTSNVDETIEKKEEVSETELLKQQLAALQVQLNVLLANKNNDEGEVSDEDVKINKDDYIKILSLCPNTLALRTSGNKKFIFREYGEIKRILYSDLVEILEIQGHFAEAGIFYIMDKRVVRRHGLDPVYEKILTKEKLEEIIEGSGDTALGIFKNTNETQKRYIVDMLIEKVRDQKPVDMNLIYAISRESKIDIAAKAEEAREFEKLLMGDKK